MSGEEYWIRESGDVDFADGDIGDYNHEAIVIIDVQRSIIERVESNFDVKQTNWYGSRSFADSEYVDWDAFKQALAQACAEELKQKKPEKAAWIDKELENNPERFTNIGFKRSGIKQDELSCAEGTTDARTYAMRKWGWKAYRDGSIDTWSFTQNDLATIVSGIESIADEEGWSDKKLARMSFTITIFSSQKHLNLSYQQLKNPRQRANATTPETGNLISYGTSNASKQVRDMEYDALHPAYKRPGVFPFGDWTMNFTDWLEKKEFGNLLKEDNHDKKMMDYYEFTKKFNLKNPFLWRENHQYFDTLLDRLANAIAGNDPQNAYKMISMLYKLYSAGMNIEQKNRLDQLEGMLKHKFNGEVPSWK